jgi:hypothetical protein
MLISDAPPRLALIVNISTHHARLKTRITTALLSA